MPQQSRNLGALSVVALAALLAFAACLAVAPARADAASVPSSAPAAAASARRFADAVLVAPPGASIDQEGLRATVASFGARVALVYPPQVLVAQVGEGAVRRLRAKGFAVLRAGAAPPTGAPAGTARALRLVSALTRLMQGRSAAGNARSAALGPDLLRSPATGLRTSDSAASDGRSSPLELLPAPLTGPLGIIFTESDGSIDRSTENWTDADPLNPGDRRAAVLTRIDLALAWWSALAPGAGLTFVVPPEGAAGAPRTVATPYEPISRVVTSSPWTASKSDALWRWPIMSRLGYAHSSYDNPPAELAFDNDLRFAHDADWAVTLYVVDNLHDIDGRFRDGAIAYTYSLFGPYMVLTYTNAEFGPAAFDYVLAHELGHVFGALDEYDAGPDYPSGANLYSGYLWVRNANSLRGGSTDFPCIMRSDWEGQDAYYAGQLCPSSRGQSGLRDGDGDGIPNVVDTAPRFTDQPQIVEPGGAVTVAGTVREKPWPRGENSLGSAFLHDISIFVPRDVRFRVDGGPWVPAAAADGAFDETQELFTLTTDPLSDGHHLLEVEATTGTAATLVRDLWAGQTPVQLALAAARTTITYGGTVGLTVASTSGGFPVPHLAGVRVGRAGSAGTTGVTDGAGRWIRVIRPSRLTRYVATFAGSGQFTGPAESNIVTVKVRVAIREHRAPSPIRLGGTMPVWGTVSPAKPGARVLLDESRDGGKSWRVVQRRRTDVHSAFRFGYLATHRGRILLRVRYAGDAANLGNTRAVAPFTVL